MGSLLGQCWPISLFWYWIWDVIMRSYLLIIMLQSVDYTDCDSAVIRYKNSLCYWMKYYYWYVLNKDTGPDDIIPTCFGSKDNSLQAVELSGQSDLKIVVNPSLQTVSSTIFWIRVSLQRLSWLITHRSSNNPRTPRDQGYASWSQEMYTRTLALLTIHVRCVFVMSRMGGELFVQSSFWLGTFEVFWSSKHIEVPTN